ncbi:MAG: metalloregulator ArsR/SmtB family transcription factor [Halobacteriales archaeon]|nr:metalloregulator ArsR/SmtB family transcription factor [Halobacteriales archaeon]
MSEQKERTAEQKERLRSRLGRFLEEHDDSTDCCSLDERVEKLTDLREETRPEDTGSDVRLFSVLANETRYELLRLLAGASRPLCVCEFAPLFDVSESTVSQAVGELVDAGLVSREKQGRWRFYETTERGEKAVEMADGIGKRNVG